MAEERSLEEKYDGWAEGLYSIWDNSVLMRNMHELNARVLASHVLEQGLEVVRLVDIGIGLGIQTVRALRKLPDQVREVDIAGVDISRNSLCRAETAILALQGEGLSIRFMAIHGKFEGLSGEQLQEMSPVDAVTAILSLHHLPGPEKMLGLHKIRQLEPSLVLIGETDAHMDIDLDTSDPQFAKNLCENYDAAIQAIRDEMKHVTDPALLGAMQAVIDVFIEKEKQELLKRPKEDRLEYQIRLEEWQSLLKESGFEIVPPTEKLVSGLVHGGLHEQYVISDAYGVFGFITAKPA